MIKYNVEIGYELFGQSQTMENATFGIVAIEIPRGKRNLNMNINAQQVIPNA